MDLSFQGDYGSRPLEFFYQRTPDNYLRSLKAGIQKNIPSLLNKYSIHRLSPFFCIILTKSHVLIFDSRVLMVQGRLNFFLKGPVMMTWEPLKYVSKKIHPTAIKQFDPFTFTVFWQYISYESCAIWGFLWFHSWISFERDLRQWPESPQSTDPKEHIQYLKKKIRSIDYHRISYHFLRLSRIDLRFEGSYGSRTLEFF